jgi:hypothetical protein
MSDTTAVEIDVFDSAACRGMLDTLNAFENLAYPDDMRCPWQDFSHWIDSRSFFYAAVGRRNEAAFEPLSIASFLLASSASAERLIAGHGKEAELQPWDAADGQDPVAYFASFILGDRRHGPLLFDSLQRDFLAFRRSLRHGCSASSVFSIPLSDAGIDYLRRRNYTSEPARYRGKYPILRLLPQQCSSGLWKVVFATDG